MPSILEIKDLGELMKRGWSYRTGFGGGGGTVNGIYCWKRYTILADGSKVFNNFVVSDDVNHYPDNEAVDGYYYETIKNEDLIQLMVNTSEGSSVLSNVERIEQIDSETIALQISI